MFYHKKIGFPQDVEVPDVEYRLHYTRHALMRSRQRLRYVGRKEVPKILVIKKNKIVELEMKKDSNKIVGCTIRLMHDKKVDIVLILKFNHKKKLAKVVTVWFNERKDNHRKVDVTKYNTP
jgi:hypothetical protein